MKAKNVTLKFCFASVLLFFISCSVQNSVNKDDFKKISNDFSVSFYDKLDTLKYSYDNRIVTRSFIKDFTNTSSIDYSKPIQLDIKNDNMYIKFEDENKKSQVLKFFGKQHNRKFVFYTNYETISFPILFMKKSMTRYCIYLSSENELYIKNTDVSEGLVLLFGGQNNSEKNYKFKIIKNE